MLMALSIFIVMVIPFSSYRTVQHRRWLQRADLECYFLYCLVTVRNVVLLYHPGKNSRKTVCIFVVMSYGFFVTSTVTFLHRTFRFPSDHFMYPPLALILTLIINLSSCETISHADGANPYYDQRWSGITYLEDSLLPPCFVYSNCQHCTILKHNKSFHQYGCPCYVCIVCSICFHSICRIL